MKSQIEELRRLTKKEADEVTKMLARAFWNDPLMAYFFPEQKNKKKLLPALLKYRLKYGFMDGEVYATPNLEGVAVWSHSESMGRSLWKDIRAGGLGLIRLCGLQRIKLMSEVEEFSSKRREKYVGTPYVRLGPIAVDPKHQGQGLASRLMRPMLNRLDSQGSTCCLETQSKRLVSLYEHFGFEAVAEGTVPDTDIPHWNMIRPPNEY